MHQYPRPPPVTASPANSEQTNPTRTNNPRDRDVQNLRTASPHTQGSGSSEDFAPAKQDLPANDPGAQIQRLNQVIQNFHTKAALIVLHSRVDLAPAYSKGADNKRVNRWFNIELDETDDYKEDIRRWKTCDLKDNRPPPLVIEILLNTDTLNANQRLVILDDDGKRWDVMNALASSQGARNGKRRASAENEVVLERWVIQLQDHNSPLPPDLAQLLPLVYKKSIVLFRSLFTYCNFLPAWKLSRKIGKVRSNGSLKLSYRILDGSQLADRHTDGLTVPLCDSLTESTAEYSFGVTESPAGPFSVHVTYRLNCEFRVDDSEALLSSRFATSDDELFPPSLPRDDQPARSHTQEVGSLPTDHRRNLMQRPELGQAYGSLGTFHQAGIATGTSPISALRNAQDYSSASPPTSDRPRSPPLQLPDRSNRASTGGMSDKAGRRTSISFQPFKAPLLSASPMAASPLSSSPRTVSGRMPVLGSLTEESHIPPPNLLGQGARKSISVPPEQVVTSSASSSPKPAPITRFSSSFGHRRARLSTGGTTTKTDDDQNSSGKVSATSSAAQPGSGLMAEATGGGSSGSMQEDDENISDFLKMLDQKKDLLTPSDAASAEASTRRTTAALNRFHRMRDSNAALSDSMSSSLMLHRSSSSSSRQLSSVPAMVHGTSASTSSSPKPTSPHTPHTPFAPSRLSAAYSHDDTDTQHHLTIVEEPPSPSEAANSEDTTQELSNANVTAIDIPSSPRPFLPGYRRSSSAQRGPLPEDDDIGDLYGMRSASMGAHDRRGNSRRGSEKAEAVPVAENAGTPVQPPDTGPTLTPTLHGTDGTGSGPSTTHHVYRSRLARTAAAAAASGRGVPVTPPQGSTSSFGEPDRGGGSAEGSAGSGSWGRGGINARRRESRAENRFGLDEEEGQDEFLPFAMERSDFAGTGPGTGGSASRR